jgi:hypothetical protein
MTHRQGSRRACLEPLLVIAEIRPYSNLLDAVRHSAGVELVPKETVRLSADPAHLLVPPASSVLAAIED